MNQEQMMTKFHELKGNLHQLGEKVQKLIKSHADKVSVSKETNMDEDAEGEDNYVDDLPLTINREPQPGIKFYSTENSEFARGAARQEAHGIDSFGEEDTFDADEADEHQTFRDRKQNSDLSKRFYTNGLNIDDLNK